MLRFPRQQEEVVLGSAQRTYEHIVILFLHDKHSFVSSQNTNAINLNPMQNKVMSLEILTAVAMKITFFWNVRLCSMVNIFSFTLKMEAERSSETPINSTRYMESHSRSWQSSHSSKFIPIPFQIEENDVRIFHLQSV